MSLPNQSSDICFVMNKVKSILNKLLTWFKTAPIVKAVAVWIVLLIVLAFAVDKLVMPIFSGHFASTGEVPNLEGMTQEAAEKALDEAGFKYEWLEEGRYNACRTYRKAWPYSQTYQELGTSRSGNS